MTAPVCGPILPGLYPKSSESEFHTSKLTEAVLGAFITCQYSNDMSKIRKGEKLGALFSYGKFLDIPYPAR